MNLLSSFHIRGTWFPLTISQFWDHQFLIKVLAVEITKDVTSATLPVHHSYVRCNIIKTHTVENLQIFL